MNKFAHTCVLISFLGMSIAFTNSADAQANLLSDPSFELPDASDGDVGGCEENAWDCFNSNYISSNNFRPGGSFANPTAHSGTQVLKQFYIDAGYFQDAAANPGDTVDASVYAMNWNGDNFNNVFLLQIFALDAGGNNISGGGEFDPVSQVVAAAPAIGAGADYVLSGTDGGNDFDWTQMMVSAVMPSGTAATRIQLIHILVGSTPDYGAIFLDDASLTVTAVPVPIAIDIKPGSDTNSINVGSAGVIPVAILSTADFDALTVDPTSVSLAGASVKLVGKSDKYLCHQEDVNIDGLIDLVCQVYTAQFMIDEGETTAILEAKTLDGTKLRGEDFIRVVPDN